MLKLFLGALIYTVICTVCTVHFWHQYEKTDFLMPHSKAL